MAAVGDAGRGRGGLSSRLAAKEPPEMTITPWTPDTRLPEPALARPRCTHPHGFLGHHRPCHAVPARTQAACRIRKAARALCGGMARAAAAPLWPAHAAYGKLEHVWAR